MRLGKRSYPSELATKYQSFCKTDHSVKLLERSDLQGGPLGRLVEQTTLLKTGRNFAGMRGRRRPSDAGQYERLQVFGAFQKPAFVPIHVCHIGYSLSCEISLGNSSEPALKCGIIL